VIDIWYDADHSETYNIRWGNTYAYYRTKPGAAPEVATCEGPGPTRPSPPGSPSADSGSAETCFAPLSKFIVRCKELKHPYRLSLKQLAAECAEAQQSGGTLPTELRYVHGFTWFVGYLVDDANHDVVLLGIKDPTRPPLDIDCLATAIKCAYAGSVPRCSLEGHPDPAFQKSIVEGVPWNTRWAEVMIYADYDMKRLFQGHLDPKIEGFKSQKQHFREVLSARGFAGEGRFSSQVTNANYENRWWFNFNSQVPRAVSDSAGRLVYLYRNPVRVSTEQKIDGAFGSGQTTMSGRLFAENLTDNMDEVGLNYPSIAELQGLYRLYDLMRHLHDVSKAAPPAMIDWVKQYEHPYQGPPSAMPTLTYSQKVWVRSGSGYVTQTWNNRGGVEMGLAITPESLKRAVQRDGSSVPDVSENSMTDGGNALRPR
jgi:hypothetical protein